MSDATAYPLHRVRRYAARILRAIRRECLKAKVAGSVRRRLDWVHDLDIVVLPKSREAIKRRCLAKCMLLKDGNENFSFMAPDGMHVEIYFARPPEPALFGGDPCTWASLLLCRTGSKEHNVRFALAAKIQGLHWDPYRGLVDRLGCVTNTPTERALYAALGMPYQRPEDRK